MLLLSVEEILSEAVENVERLTIDWSLLEATIETISIIVSEKVFVKYLPYAGIG